MKEIGLALRKFFSGADIPLLLLCMLCSGLSLLMLSSVTTDLPGGPDRYILIQAGAAGVGILLFLIFTVIDVNWLARRWPFLLAFGIGFNLLLLLFGEGGDTGNISWLYLPGIATGIQPAEITKITFILVLAAQMYFLRERISGLVSVALMGTHLGMMVVIIRFTSRDDGMILVYCFIFLFMCVASGLKFRWFAAAAVVLGVSVPLVWNNLLTPNQRMRFLVVLNPGYDLSGIGWHADKSKTALGAGQLFGQGLHQGQQAQLGNFPAKHTDFMFSMIGEEFGFLGCITVMLLLFVIILRCLYIATRAKSGLGSLVCVGVAGMVIFQTFENIGMCLGVMPVVGLTLPFFSYGGSSTLSLYAAMGLISSVRFHPMPDWQKRQELVKPHSLLKG